MKKMTTLAICAAGIIATTSAMSEENYLGRMTNLSDAVQQLAYVRSLDWQTLMTLASQAYAAGWDDHAVAVAIVGPVWEKKPPTQEQILAVLADGKLHPRLRAKVGMGGLGSADNWEGKTVLAYIDTLIAMIEDSSIPYSYKEGLAGRLCRYVQGKSKVGNNAALPYPEAERANIEQLLDRAARVLIDLAQVLEKGPKQSPDTQDVCVDLIECLGWTSQIGLSETNTATKARQAIRSGQDALVRVLADEDYSAEAARLVLRRFQQSKLQDVITKETVARIKRDKRFSSEEDQRLLNYLDK